MNIRIYSLVFAPFAFGTSAFVFVGLLEPMAAGLGIGVPLVGQLQTVFAVACGIGGPILARVLRNVARKPLLQWVMVVLTLMNIGSALAPEFGAIAAIRLVSGFFVALTLPLATTLAVGMVSKDKHADAIAIVLAGYTVAFLVGMPIGSLLGDLYGWHCGVVIASGSCATSPEQPPANRVMDSRAQVRPDFLFLNNTITPRILTCHRRIFPC